MLFTLKYFSMTDREGGKRLLKKKCARISTSKSWLMLGKHLFNKMCALNHSRLKSLAARILQ